MPDLRELNRIVKLLREHSEMPILDPRTKGLIGNLLGEVKVVVQSEEHNLYAQSAEVRDIIREFETDPVIQTYLQTRADWKDKIQSLRSELSGYGDSDYS